MRIDERNRLIVERNRELYTTRIRYLHIEIAPTMNCQAHCWYCFENACTEKHTMSKGVTLDTIEFIKTQILRSQCEELCLLFFGGEPLLAIDQIMTIGEAISSYCESNGKKYCKDSITVAEEALHGAVVRALKRFHAEDESTYLTLMKATIGEAIGINGGSEEIDLLTRRIDTLNKRMLDLVNETVAAGKDVESSEDEFKGISDQIEQLNRRIAAIQESIHKDGSRQARLEEIQNIIAERNANETQYDDSIVRQMIECIKVHNDGKLTIIFGGGYEIEETL